MKGKVTVTWLGREAYESAWARQRSLVQARAAGDAGDTLLLLEHPPVYTMGRRAKKEHLLLDAAARQQAGIALHHVDRGGDITYHGPGQLVGYPILDLKRLYRAWGYPRPDLHHYLRALEEVLIRALRPLGIDGWRYEGYTGVWTGERADPRKIAAIGVKVSSKGISSHGFALNVDPNLDHFAGIVPCGIDAHGVTSVAQLAGRPLSVAELLAPVTTAFAGVFELAAIPGPALPETASGPPYKQ